MLHIQYKTKPLMRCRYRSFAIPLGSGLALLLALATATIVPGNDMVSAVDGENDASLESVAADSPMTYADNNLSFTIGGAGQNEAVKTLAGQVAYRAHTVQVTSSSIRNYSVVINGPVGLENSANTTPITGAGEKTPSEMGDNSWGFAYGQTGDNDKMTYSSFTGANQTIDSANATPNFTKNLVFAAKFGEQAGVGHYTGTVTLSITATPKVVTNYSLSYDANGGSGAPSVQNYADDTETGSHVFTISTAKPTRSGYEFAGWATSSTGSVAYQPGGSITLQASSPSQTLYAKWNQIYTRTLNYDANGGIGVPNNQSCSSASESCEIIISSIKPTKEKYVFQSWNTEADGSGTAHDANSSITISANITLYAIWRDARTLNNITTMQEMVPDICSNTAIGDTKTLTDTRDNSVYNIRKHEDGLCWMTTDLKIMGSRVLTPETSDVKSNWTLPASSSPSGFTSNTASKTYSYGSRGYYSWCAVTANSCGSASTNGSTAAYSVCPKGWRLPTAYEYLGLVSALGVESSEAGSKKLRNEPYNFNYTGGIPDGEFVNPANYMNGYWWSSTSGGSSIAYHLDLTNKYFNAANPFVRYSGYTARCIAR